MGTQDSNADQISAADTFAVLGNEIRTEVLRVLVERRDETPLPFSELRRAVGTDDGGQFNYHLQQLVGAFLEHTDEGYSLGYAGRRIAHALLAGKLTGDASMEPTATPGSCYACGTESLRASYVDGRFTVRCGECGERVLSVPFAPSVVRNRTPEGVIRAFNRWGWTQAMLAADRVCPECHGELDGSISTDVAESLPFDAQPKFVCGVCQYPVATSFGSVALQHPEVLAAHHRRGRYPRERHYWTIDQLVSSRHTEFRSRDPWRVRVAFPLESARVEATIDGSATVIDVEVTE